MLELQSLQKEQLRREQLLKIQKDDECAIKVTVPLRKGNRSGTDQTDELRLNNNRDTLHFDGDANDDDIGITVADDIILMKADSNSEKMYSQMSSFDSSTRSTTITVIKSFSSSTEFFQTYSVALITNTSIIINSHKTLSPIWTTVLTQILCQPLTKQIIAVQIQLLPKSTMGQLPMTISPNRI